MQNLNTNTNPADLLFSGQTLRTLTKNFHLVHSPTSIYLSNCFDLQVLMGNIFKYTASFNI